MRSAFLNHVFVFACITSLLTGCRTSEPSKAATVKVMTYNIRIGKGGGEWNTDPTKVDLEPVARLVEAHRPDLVGLQEVDRNRQRTGLMDQPAELSKRLGMHIAFEPAYSVPTTSGTDEEYGNALLSRTPITSSKRYPLFKPDYRQSHPQYPDYYSEQRGVLRAETTLTGKTVQVLVTHLGLTPDQREKQIAEVARIATTFDGPTIIMGDFNAPPEEPAMTMLGAQFQDMLTEANLSAADRRTFPAGANPKNAIDYIFVSKHFRVRNATVIRDETLASDHNPVIAEIELLPAPKQKSPAR